MDPIDLAAAKAWAEAAEEANRERAVIAWVILIAGVIGLGAGLFANPLDAVTALTTIGTGGALLGAGLVWQGLSKTNKYRETMERLREQERESRPK